MIASSWVAIYLAVIVAVERPVKAEVSGGPYCGVYCVYTTAKMCGRVVAFEDLLSQNYVGSYKGSTVAELRQAIESIGLTATPMTGLTPAALRASTQPIILHVRRPGHTMPYAHWVVYAGEQDGSARVIDPPGSVELVPFAELAALWDGVGVMVSDGPADESKLRLAAWTESAILLAMVTAALAACRCLLSHRLRPWSAGSVILAIGGAVGLGSQLASPDGLLRNHTAVGQVAGQHFKPTILEIDFAEVKALVASKTVSVIDARVPADFATGHLPGAVSLPVFAGLAERRVAASSLPPGKRVVVYCQSNGCKWADAVAADLYYRGFTDVVVFRGGWREWVSYE